MGVQLIFVVEANKSCKSDWIYIKSTIDYFYEYNRTGLKLSPVYMDGKGNYKQKEKEVKSLISQYSNPRLINLRLYTVLIVMNTTIKSKI